ncbi:IS3 family transposase [Piscirickettsia salmonis]
MKELKAGVTEYIEFYNYKRFQNYMFLPLYMILLDVMRDFRGFS